MKQSCQLNKWLDILWTNADPLIRQRFSSYNLVVQKKCVWRGNISEFRSVRNS